MPPRPTGTAEDMMSLVSRAEEHRLLREGTVFPRKHPLLRLILEVPLNLAGKFVAFLVRALPPDLSLAFHGLVFRALAAPRHYPYRRGLPGVVQGRELLARVARETGKTPAVLALISHPPAHGDLLHFNFELVRHAMLALREIRNHPCRPRLVIAVDPFALDTTPLITEALYAGTMGTYHVGLDRLAQRRSALSGMTIREAAWSRMPYRLLRLLRGGGEVGLVLAGGVPSTTRILYASKEWLADQVSQSPLRRRPRAALAALAQNPSFARFKKGWRSASAWRTMEAWLGEAVAGLGGGGEPQPVSPAYTGRFEGEALAAAKACLSALGFRGKDAAARLAILIEEVSRETPFRSRFFRFLSARVVEQGRPIILLPIVHQARDVYGIAIKEPWAWMRASKGRIEALRPGGDPWTGSAREFSRAFVRENFE